MTIQDLEKFLDEKITADGLIDDAVDYELAYGLARANAKTLAKKNGWTFDQALATVWRGPKPKLKKKPVPQPSTSIDPADFDTVIQTYAKNAINKEFELEKVELSNTPIMAEVEARILDAQRRIALEADKMMRDDMVSGFGIPDVPGMTFVPTTDIVPIVPDEDDNKRAESNKAMLEALDRAYRQARDGPFLPRTFVRLNGPRIPGPENKPTPPAAPLSKHGRVILPEDDG